METQEGILEEWEKGAAHSEARKGEGTNTDGGTGRQKRNRRDRDRRDERLDLGLQDAPRSTTYTYISDKARKGRTVRWHQETVHK